MCLYYIVRCFFVKRMPPNASPFFLNVHHWVLLCAVNHNDICFPVIYICICSLYSKHPVFNNWQRYSGIFCSLTTRRSVTARAARHAVSMLFQLWAVCDLSKEPAVDHVHICSCLATMQCTHNVQNLAVFLTANMLYRVYCHICHNQGKNDHL